MNVFRSTALAQRTFSQGGASFSHPCRSFYPTSRLLGVEPHKNLANQTYSPMKCNSRRQFHYGSPQLAGQRNERGNPVVTPPRLQIFNRQAHHKNRVFASSIENALPFEYIREEVSFNIVNRLEFIMKDFTTVAEVGCGRGWIYRMLSESYEDERSSPETEPAPLFKKWNMSEYALLDQSENNLMSIPDVSGLEVARILANEERLPLQDGSFDLVLSAHHLHNINDLEGVFSQIHTALKPDGCFVGAMFGENTLHELKSCFVWAEHEREGGISPHVSPMVGIRDVGNLLTGAGFKLPTVDSDEITVYYPDAFTLMKHLQLMGEGNVVMNRRPMISKQTLLAAAALYDELFYDEARGGVPATFEIVYMIGWKHHESQPKPKARGSAEFSLKSFAEEMKTDLQTLSDTVPISTDEPIIEDNDDFESDDESKPR